MTKEEGIEFLKVAFELLELYEHNATDAKPEFKELVERYTDEQVQGN